MAQKEAIIIVLDVGQSMCKEGSSINDKESVLDKAKTCISMILQRKIFSESKDEIALVILGSKCTVNNLAEQYETEYENIEVVQDFKTANWDLMEHVNNISGTDISTDYIKDNALMVAIDMVQTTLSNKKFFSRRILFLSQFQGMFTSEMKIGQICADLKNNKIDINIIGPTALSEEEIKSENPIESYIDNTVIPDYSKTVVKNVLKEVGGETYSFSEALPALIYYQKKKVQPMPWNANLDIGTQLSIPISAYAKVTENKAKSWKNAYARKLQAKVEREVSYFMNDENQTKVSKEDIIPAFKYGTTLVPFTDEDKTNMEYQSGEKGIKVLGFTKAENIRRHHFIGDKSHYIFGQKNRELAGVILAPFIKALSDTNMVAIVRYVYSARSAPKIGFLAPRIKPTYECLVFLALPFMEDLRHYIFTPFDMDPKNKPTDEQLTAVDQLITSMDLSTAIVDEDMDVSEALKPKITVNPYLQRLYQCLQYRALYPDKPLPPLAAHIEAMIAPVPKLVKMSEPAIDSIRTLFPLKEVEGKKKKKEQAASEIFKKPPAELEDEQAAKKRKLSDDHVGIFDAINDKITKVGTAHPIPDFQHLLKTEALSFTEACKQLIDVVYKYLKNESYLKYYGNKIVAICKELRHESLKRNDAASFNSFLTNLRKDLFVCDLDLWHKIKNEGIGLISDKEVKTSTVTAVEAESFLSYMPTPSSKSVYTDNAPYEDDNDYEALMDDF